MNNFPQDSGIPILTEIIENPAGASADNEVEVQLSAASSASPVDHATVAQGFVPHAAGPEPTVPEAGMHATLLASPLASDRLDEDWVRIENQIVERVLTQLMQRIDFVMETRIHDILTSHLQAANVEIKNRLRETLSGVVGDLVKEQVEERRGQGIPS